MLIASDSASNPCGFDSSTAGKTSVFPDPLSSGSILFSQESATNFQLTPLSWWAVQDSNLWPILRQRIALPTELTAQKSSLCLSGTTPNAISKKKNYAAAGVVTLGAGRIFKDSRFSSEITS